MSGQKGTPRFSALACLFLLPLAGSLAGAFALLLLLNHIFRMVLGNAAIVYKPLY